MIHFCWEASLNATKTFEMIQKVYGWVCCISCYNVSLVQLLFRRARVDSWWAEKWKTNDKNARKHCSCCVGAVNQPDDITERKKKRTKHWGRAEFLLCAYRLTKNKHDNSYGWQQLEYNGYCRNDVRIIPDSGETVSEACRKGAGFVDEWRNNWRRWNRDHQRCDPWTNP